MEKLKQKKAKVLSRYFQSMEKQISGCVDDTKRLQKTTECCRKARECIKESFVTYPDGWEY